MKLLGLDFETQDDQARTTRITEVGAVLYDYNESTKVWTKIDEYSRICYEADYPPQSLEISELTGIDDYLLKKYGVPRKYALARLIPLLKQADYVFAHKVLFDKTVLLASAAAVGLEIPDKPWICTLSNFPWPKRITCRKLSHIAYEHSIYADPKTLHRAIQDVDLMFSILKTYDMEEVFKYANEPWVYLRAYPIEPWKDSYVQVNLAKKAGFQWERIKYDEEKEFKKMWVTRVKEFDYKDQFDSLPFRVERIQGIN